MSKCISAALIISAALLGCGLQAEAGPGSEGACFSIVVGKDASATGFVTVAHNEDDYIPQVVNHHTVARRTYAPGTTVQLDGDLTLEQAPETWAYLWAEIPGMLYSDSYLNEWGVCVCSDACASREDRPSLSGGGISRRLRRLIAERARTAREGVHFAGALIEKFGYAGSGRTYVIADPNEGWLFCAVNGRHWAAKRVADDEVALVANTYTLQGINLADTVNYLGSADIISYAVERGWYDPQAGGAFDFARAYSDREAAVHPSNIGRRWDGLRLVAAEAPAHGDPLPFSVVPKQKVNAKALMAVLRSHYEDTPLYGADSVSGCPHGNSVSTICDPATQTSFVAELRGDLPHEIGLVYRVCLSSPCASCYVPFYFGAAGFPESYAGDSIAPTQEDYEAKVSKPFAIDAASAFWTFTAFRHNLEGQYRMKAPEVRRALNEVEAEAFAKQEALEQQALALWGSDREGALKLLSEYSAGIYRETLRVLEGIGFER